jgi:O-Antigen ligase
MGNATAVLTAERGTRVRFGARTAESATVAVLSFAAVGGLAAGSGGYFPNNWAWASLAFAWLAASAAWLRMPSPFGRSALVLLGSLVALAAWTLASLLWAPSGEPLFASERMLVYVTAVAAAVIAVRHRTVPHLLGGTLAGLVAVDAYALATRVLPDHVGGQDVIAANRLAAPIGYWNGLGLASAFALLLALGFATRSHSLASRAFAAATLPGLFVVLYFTFSRGSWLALFGGVAVLLLVDPRRLQLATVGGAVALPAAIAVVLAWHAHALGEQGGTLAATVREGHRLGLAVAALSVVGGAVGAAAGGIERHARIRGRARLVYALVLLLLAVSAVALALARIGGPVGAIEHGWRSFTAPPIQVENGQQESKRLLSLSSNGRIDLWRAAWHEARAHPLLGGGAGSYEAWWMQHRPIPQQVRDAHSLYLQTLAEVGPLGLALLLTALCAPLLAAARNRRRPYVSFALAVWVAYLLHTGADWDWQLTGVTLPALLAATALVVTDRDEVAGACRERARLLALAGAGAAVALATLMLVGNIPLRKAMIAADEGRWTESAVEAREASAWIPWTSEPSRLLGEAQLATRNLPAARHALRAALVRDGLNWQLWFDLSAAERGIPAARSLSRASRLNPLSPEVAQDRAFVPTGP